MVDSKKEKKKSNTKKEKKENETVQKFKEIKESAKGSLSELGMALQLGEFVINEMTKKMKESFPKLGNPFSPYKGKFAPYIVEYVNEFIIPEANEIKDLDEAVDTELYREVLFIELFCKWIEQEKRIIIKKRSEDYMFKEFLLKKQKNIQERIYSYSENKMYKDQMRLLKEIIKNYETQND